MRLIVVWLLVCYGIASSDEPPPIVLGRVDESPQIIQINGPGVPSGDAIEIEFPVVNQSGRAIELVSGGTRYKCTSAVFATNKLENEASTTLKCVFMVPSMGPSTFFSTSVAVKAVDGLQQNHDFEVLFRLPKLNHLAFKKAAAAFELEGASMEVDLPFVCTISKPDLSVECASEYVKLGEITSGDKVKSIKLIVDAEALRSKDGGAVEVRLVDTGSEASTSCTCRFVNNRPVRLSPNVLYFRNGSEGLSASAILRFNEKPEKPRLNILFGNGRKRCTVVLNRLSDRVYRSTIRLPDQPSEYGQSLALEAYVSASGRREKFQISALFPRLDP